jgi:hypothetical protein
MLDQIERWRILEQPARKNPPPGKRRIAIDPLFDENLQECAGFGGLLPRQGALAGCHADNKIADPLRLTRFHGEVLGQIVALVEHADRGDAILHRRAEFAFNRRPTADGGCRQDLGHFLLPCVTAVIAIAAAAAQSEQRRAGQGKQAAFHASGCQAS